MKYAIVIILYLIFMWLWDVAHVVAWNNYNATLGNGFWNISAVAVYHSAWYFSIILFFIVLYHAHNLEKKLKGKK